MVPQIGITLGLPSPASRRLKLGLFGLNGTSFPKECHAPRGVNHIDTNFSELAEYDPSVRTSFLQARSDTLRGHRQA